MKKVLVGIATVVGLVFVAPPRQAEAQANVRAFVTGIAARAVGPDTYLDVSVIYVGSIAGGRTYDISVVPILLVPGITPLNMTRGISTALVADAATAGHVLLKTNILLPDYQVGQ